MNDSRRMDRWSERIQATNGTVCLLVYSKNGNSNMQELRTTEAAIDRDHVRLSLTTREISERTHLRGPWCRGGKGADRESTSVGIDIRLYAPISYIARKEALQAHFDELHVMPSARRREHRLPGQ